VGRILVTGAGGFVGQEVCDALLHDGHSVRAIVRNRPVRTSARNPALEVRIVGDLSEVSRDHSAFNEVDAVIHLAARVHRAGELRGSQDLLYRRENAEVTIALAETARQAGVRRFIFASSIKALGERSEERPFSRVSAARPGDAYGRSKLLAEQLLSEVCARSTLEVAIVRAPLVYGPGAVANFRELARWIKRGVPLPFASVQNRRSVISVWNLASFFARCAVAPVSRLSVLHASDAASVSTPELVRLVALGLNITPRLVSVPPSLLALGLSMLGRADLADRLCRSLEFETADSFAELGWSPPMTTVDGVIEAVREMTL
jgi:UDP-glucose 4-epimerase